MSTRIPLLGDITRPVDFISQRQVFRIEELEQAYRDMGRSAASAQATVRYHVKAGRLFVVRHGVYTRTSGWDPWLIGSRLTADAVISHDGALSHWGCTGVGHRVSFITATRTGVTRFNEVIYQSLRVESGWLLGEVATVERFGQPLQVTSLARTLVDCLALLSRGPEPVELFELFRSTARATDPAVMMRHARQYDSPLLMSRLAFFLSSTRSDLTTRQLHTLEREGLPAPDYFQRTTRSKKDTIVSRWNLIVPPALLRAANKR